MTKETLIKHTLESMNKLPIDKIKEINDFAEFLLTKIDDTILNEGIHNLVSTGESFSFLHNEPELYSDNDLIETYR